MAGEWEELTLGDLGRVVTGKTPLTSVEGNFGGRIPFVTPSDMDGRKTISTTTRFLTQAGAASVKGSVIPAGAIMVSCIGSDMGKVVVAGCECVTNQQINSIVVDDRFSSEFVYYSLSTRKNEIRHQAAGGSAVPILNKGDFSRMEITLPPLAEQKAIAAVLGALDDKIDLNRRMNATLEAMARALFQSWFVDFDPVRAKLDGRQPSGLDPATAALFPTHFERQRDLLRPQGWQMSRLGDHVDLVRGNTYKSKLKDLPGPYLLGLGSIQRNGGFRGDSLRTYGGESAPKVILHPGDVFASLKDVTQAADLLGAVARVPMEIAAGRLTQDTVKLVPRDSGISFAYLYRTLLRPEYREYCRGRATGTTNLGLSREDFLNYPVLVPPKPIQDAFDAFDSQIEAKIANNRIQAHTLATLRDTLLPKLLSGEVSPANVATQLKEML